MRPDGARLLSGRASVWSVLNTVWYWGPHYSRVLPGPGVGGKGLVDVGFMCPDLWVQL
jgi:hypothetical protein